MFFFLSFFFFFSADADRVLRAHHPPCPMSHVPCLSMCLYARPCSFTSAKLCSKARGVSERVSECVSGEVKKRERIHLCSLFARAESVVLWRMMHWIWDGWLQGHKPWLYISKNSPMDKDTHTHLSHTYTRVYYLYLYFTYASILFPLLTPTLLHLPPFHLSTCPPAHLFTFHVDCTYSHFPEEKNKYIHTMVKQRTVVGLLSLAVLMCTPHVLAAPMPINEAVMQVAAINIVDHSPSTQVNNAHTQHNSKHENRFNHGLIHSDQQQHNDPKENSRSPLALARELVCKQFSHSPSHTHEQHSHSLCS